MQEDFGNDFITLVDEDGQETEFEHIDTLEQGGQTYVALVPVYDKAEKALSDQGELVILKVIPDEETGEDILATIEDDDEYDDVADAFADRLEDYYEIES